MDAVDPKALYQLRFCLACLEKKGVEFESWFVELASHALGADFEPVAAYGPDGDFKCDGRRLKTGTIYQCYAPHHMKSASTTKKIDADFHGACQHWADWMQEWTLVHNRKEGLPPKVIQHIDQLRAQNADVAISVWGPPHLEAELFSKLDNAGWEAVFGFAPSAEGVDALVPTDIIPVIEALERETPSPSADAIEPPSPQKLQRNDLSEDVAILLQAGRTKDALVARYFDMHPSPELGEKIAVAFRRRYAELRTEGLAPDEIFTKLQQNAGGGGSAKQQTAALAVLSYYFERCDIFEDADDERP